MRTKSLLIAIVILSFVFINFKLVTPTLSELNSKIYKDKCKEVVQNYYRDLKTLIGDNFDQSEKKDLVDSVQYDCFRTSDVMVDNNIPSISQNNLEAKDYLESIISLSDQISNIDYDENIHLSDIYYNDKDRFFLVATILEKVGAKNGQGKNTSLDIYLSFDPINKLRPKIFSIQNHKEGALSNQTLAQIISENETDKRIDASKPYFLFDINPNNANINVDGKSVFYDGSKIETTPGDHTIEVTAPDYQNLKFGVAVSDTGEQHIVRNLTRKSGYLFVNSDNDFIKNPQVYIDNNMVGNTPISNYQLEVGPHDVEVKGDNNFYKLYHVSITSENSTTLNAQGNDKATWAELRSTVKTPNQSDVSYQIFYEALSPYGQWVDDPQYGNVWVPNDQDGNFRPYYTNGHWAMTDAGNTWLSYDSWGWACYHYGRWTYNAYYNWVWVPGYEWAPAWVTWRSSDSISGWAPLAPGLSVGVTNSCPNSWWVFIGTNNLYSSGYNDYRMNAENNVTYVKNSSILNNSYTNANVTYSSGPSEYSVENSTHKKIQVYHLSYSTIPGGQNLNGQTLNFYQPNLKSQNPYNAHPAIIVQTSKSLGKAQEINNINRESNFKQDLKTNKLQQRIQKKETPQQEQQRIQQQRTQQQVQSRETPQQEQQRIQQQRAQQQVQSRETSQQEKQQIQYRQQTQQPSPNQNKQQVVKQPPAQQTQVQNSQTVIQKPQLPKPKKPSIIKLPVIKPSPNKIIKKP